MAAIAGAAPAAAQQQPKVRQHPRRARPTDGVPGGEWRTLRPRRREHALPGPREGDLARRRAHACRRRGRSRRSTNRRRGRHHRHAGRRRRLRVRRRPTAAGCSRSTPTRGELVWKAKLPYGGGVNSSVALTKAGACYVGVSRTSQSPRAARRGDPCIGPVRGRAQPGERHARLGDPVDRRPGRLRRLRQPGVLRRRCCMIGVSGGSAELGDEADRYAFQGSMVFLDARNGQGADEDLDDPPARAARRRLRGRRDLVHAGDRPRGEGRLRRRRPTRSARRPSTRTRTRC